MFTVIIKKNFLHEIDIFDYKSAILIKIVFVQKKNNKRNHPRPQSMLIFKITIVKFKAFVT
jgi:hypothetical protein